MIMEFDAEIDHDNVLNVFRQSAAEAMVHRQEELLLYKHFVAAKQATIYTHTQSLAFIRQSGLKPLIPKSMSYNNSKRVVCLNIDLIYDTAGYVHKFYL